MAVLKYWDETLSQWLPVAPGPKGDKGDKGDTGDLANLDIGTVTTGSPAAAHIDGNFEDGYELDLTLPSVGAGSIHNADVNAAAGIDPTKIAGTALTIASSGEFNVRHYGAVGNGTTDDTIPVQAAIDAAAVSGGIVVFPPGVWRCNVILKPKVTLLGHGVDITTLKAVAGSDTNVITGLNFATLTGKTYGTGDPLLGVYKSQIRRLSIDGDKATQSAGWGIQVWGSNLAFVDIQVQNCKSGGIWTEYTTQDPVEESNVLDNMLEASFNRIKIVKNDGDGWRWRGPHDSYMDDVVIAVNDGWGINGDRVAGQNLLTARCVNSWMNTSGSFSMDGQAHFHDCIASGATGPGVVFGPGTGNNRFHGAVFGHPIGIIAQGDQVNIDIQGGSASDTWLQVGVTGAGGGCGWLHAVLEGTDVVQAVDFQNVHGPVDVRGQVTCATLMTGDHLPNAMVNLVNPLDGPLSETYVHLGALGFSNLLTANQAAFGTDTTGWVPKVNCDLAHNTGGGAYGVGRLRMNALAAGTVSAELYAYIPVAAGKVYTAMAAFVANDVPARTARVGIEWFYQNETSISSVAGYDVTTPTGGGDYSLVSSITAVAPAGAVFALMYLEWLEAAAAWEAQLVDGCGFWRGAGGVWDLPGRPIANLGFRPDPADGSKVQVWNPGNASWIAV